MDVRVFGYCSNEPGGSKMNKLYLATTLVVGGVFMAGTTAYGQIQGAERGAETEFTSVANREHGCLTEAIYREAGSEPIRGRMAVAQVIMNRTRSGTFPKTVCGVVHQPRQFNFPKGLGPRKGVGEAKLWAEAKAIASLAIKGAIIGISEPVLYFSSAAGRGIGRARLVTVIGRHSFYVDR